MNDDNDNDDDEPTTTSANSDSGKFGLVPTDDPAYETLADLIGAHHDELAEAKIALAWAYEVKPDRDGHLVWGRARKVGPLERTFHDHDFVIVLNNKVWGALPDVAKRALLDHELSHCGSKESEAGDVSYYVRKHDLEEFVSIVRSYGLWRDTVQVFVDAALKREQGELFDEGDEGDEATATRSEVELVGEQLMAAGAKPVDVNFGKRTVTLTKKRSKS